MQRLLHWFSLLAITALAMVMKPWTALAQVQDAIVQTKQASEQGQSQTAQLIPGSVYDGDTLRVILNGAQTRIWLGGIDASEHD